jgi:hypothetical protein
MKAPANNLANATDNVVEGLTGNAAFDDPPVEPADLAALNAAMRTAITAADAGGRMQQVAKLNAIKAVRGALRKLASYVEIAADNDLEILLSSGFVEVRTNLAQSPLVQPVILKILNLATTQLLIRLQRVYNAKSFQVQTSLASAGPWVEQGISTQARRIVISDLTPGTVYFVRVRGVGGSTKYSEWSVPVSLMVT